MEGKTEQAKLLHLKKGIKGSIEEANVLTTFVNQERDKGRDFESVYRGVQKAMQMKEAGITYEEKVLNPIRQCLDGSQPRSPPTSRAGSRSSSKRSWLEEAPDSASAL